MFNFNDNEDFITYHKVTENNEELLNCFDDENINVSSKRWLKIFTNILYRSFKKVRICKNKSIQNLTNFQKKREQFKKEKSKEQNDEDGDKCEQLDDEIAEVNDKSSDLCAEKNKTSVEDFLKHTDDGIEGFSQPKIWKMKKSFAPKNTFDPPSPKIYSNENLISDLKNDDDEL